jgi:membrane fusion protein (multidrug efflux system)
MKKKIIIISVIALLLIGYFVKHFNQNNAPQVESVTVQASTVKESTLPQEAHAIGTLTARSVEITPEIAGHVQKILFKDGSFVKEGTPLIQLDNAVYKAKYTSARAKLIYSDNNYKRMVLLGKRGAIAKQAIDQAEADLKERQADADESEVMLNKMALTAPFDGVVGKSKVSPGDYVTIGQSVVTLTDIKHLRIEYNVPDTLKPLLKIGQEVKITTTAYPSKIFSGTVSFISPTINVDTRSLSLYADVSNENNLLAPGMFVDVIQSLDSEERVVMVPARSLVPILDGEQVYKIVEGKAYAVTVSIGKRSLDSVQITQGLSPGDVVITDGQLKVKNGLPVRIKT